MRNINSYLQIMEDWDEIDFSDIPNQRKLLESISVDRYWNEFKGDWKAYLTDVFKYEDTPQPFKKTIIVEIKESHPFEDWF